jgi:hypothetical protein
MLPEEVNKNLGEADQIQTSLSRREIAKKAVYVAPAVLAVIATAERPALAASVTPPV